MWKLSLELLVLDVQNCRIIKRRVAAQGDGQLTCLPCFILAGQMYFRWVTWQSERVCRSCTS